MIYWRQCFQAFCACESDSLSHNSQDNKFSVSLLNRRVNGLNDVNGCDFYVI